MRNTPINNKGLENKIRERRHRRAKGEKRKRKKDPELEKLKMENEMLKQLLAEKELELKVKDCGTH